MHDPIGAEPIRIDVPDKVLTDLRQQAGQDSLADRGQGPALDLWREPVLHEGGRRLLA